MVCAAARKLRYFIIFLASHRFYQIGKDLGDVISTAIDPKKNSTESMATPTLRSSKLSMLHGDLTETQEMIVL